MARTCIRFLLAVTCLLATLEGATRPPNILWIVSEDNGPELGCYGDKYARTPHLDRLAAEGVRFERAFVPFSVCSPSRAAFLTGLYPQQNGHLGLATHKFALYRPDTPNVVTLLKPAGYRAGIIGKLHVNPASAFPFDFTAIPGANFLRLQPAEDYVKAAEKFWQESGDKPWFLSVNFPDAHLPFLRQANGRPARPQSAADVKSLPWIGTDSERLRDVTADYYNCMARLDEGVGLLLAALDKAGGAQNTLVAYIGDHGAQFARSKGSVYDCALRVPLLMRWPGNIPAGLVRTELASTLDLLPTALQAAGVPDPAGLAGRPLQPLFRQGESPSPWREYIHAVTTGAYPVGCFVQESIQDSRWKLIWTPPQPRPNGTAGKYLGTPGHPPAHVSGLDAAERSALTPRVKAIYDRWVDPPPYELYDLKSDPHEFTNLADEPAHAAVKARLIAAFKAFQIEIRDPFMDPRNVEAYVTEQITHRESNYSRDPAFRWKHTDAFHAWRERRQPYP